MNTRMDKFFFFKKRCVCCNEIYYTKEIEEDQFSVLEENDNIEIVYDVDSLNGITVMSGIIHSNCGKHSQ